MSPRRSARIRARLTAVTAIGHSLLDTAATEEPDKLWCLCGGIDDGRLMLYCEQQSVGCCV